MNITSGQFDDEYDNGEYSLPGDARRKQQPVRYQRPDTTEYMMRQKGPESVHEYYSKDGYQYGKRPKGWKK